MSVSRYFFGLRGDRTACASCRVRRNNARRHALPSTGRQSALLAVSLRFFPCPVNCCLNCHSATSESMRERTRAREGERADLLACSGRQTSTFAVRSRSVLRADPTTGTPSATTMLYNSENMSVS